jgi:hypothetical protein
LQPGVLSGEQHGPLGSKQADVSNALQSSAQPSVPAPSPCEKHVSPPTSSPSQTSPASSTLLPQMPCVLHTVQNTEAMSAHV